MSSLDDFLAVVVIIALAVGLGWGSFAIWPSGFFDTAFSQMTPMMLFQCIGSILMGLFSGVIVLFIFFGLIGAFKE